jgi:hypothetical protein
MVRAAGLAVCILFSIGCQRETFFCDTPEDCSSGGGGGACESTGYCSFPDPECDTGRRYGDLAPSGLAGTCVPRMSDTEGSGGADPTSGSSTGPSDPTLADPTSSSTSDASTTEPPSESSTSTSGGESSSTDDTPACCDASCSVCGDACQSEVLDSTDEGEALAVVVVGTTLVWTTGYAREVHTIDLTSGESTLLTTANETITNVATDGEHLYYLSYGDGVVRRISLTTGAQGIVTDANDAEPESQFEAGFGQIVLDDSHVYFALANPSKNVGGGAFRAPKNPIADQAPERIGTLERPVGIGVDEESIYISDQATDALYRFDKGAPEDGVTMHEITFPGHLFVTQPDVYGTGSGRVFRIPKDGSPPLQLATTGGEILGITGDGEHVYVSDIQAGSVTRISMFDTEPPVQIATSPGARGIATDCNHVYWCENGSLSVLRQPK